MSDRHRTIRMQVTEVYEAGSDSDLPLFIASDAVMARENSEPGDRLVTSWWVREGQQP